MREGKYFTLCLSVLVCILFTSAAPCEEITAQEFETLYQAWKQSQKAMSPYLSDGNTQEFGSMIKKGPKIVPFLLKKLDGNPDELDLVTALFTISRKRFERKEWSENTYGDRRIAAELYKKWWILGRFHSCDDFSELYTILRRIPNKESDEFKQTVLRIRFLGIAAIPCMMDKLDEEPALIPEIDILVRTDQCGPESTASQCREWWEQNKEKYLFPPQNSYIPSVKKEDDDGRK